VEQQAGEESERGTVVRPEDICSKGVRGHTLELEPGGVHRCRNVNDNECVCGIGGESGGSSLYDGR
jgi:hypothetical protein